MERPIPPYEGGKGDDNFAVYQANKEVWRVKHLHESIIDGLHTELKIENQLRKTRNVKEFNERLLDLYPSIVLSFRSEFPVESQDSLGNLLPVDYREGSHRLVNWRFNAQSLLNANIGERIPGLKERAQQLCEQSHRKAPDDVANRAVNNFLYIFKEEMLYPPTQAIPAYKKELHAYRNNVRLRLHEVIGEENTHKIHICMEYLKIVYSTLKQQRIKYGLVRKLLRSNVSKEIRRAVDAKSYKARRDPELRQRAVEFVLDEVFGDDLRDIEEMQD